MSRLHLLAVSLLVVACGTTSYSVIPEPVALAAPGPNGPWPSVGYWGPHPIPAGFGGGFDYTEGPHAHPYTPDQPDLYAAHDGYFVFVGDPYFYGYDGPMRWYAGPHVLRYPWGEVVCPIDGPHRHWEYAATYVYDTDYVVVDGFWVYVGLWPVWWHHDHVVYLDHYWPRPYHDHYASYRPRAHAAMEAAPPRHTTSGQVTHEPGKPGVHDLPPAHGRPDGSATPVGRDAHPGVPPAYDENRHERLDAAPGQTGVFHGRDADAPQGTRRDRQDRPVPGGTNLPPAWNDGRSSFGDGPGSKGRPGAAGKNETGGRAVPGSRAEPDVGLPLPVERGTLEPLDGAPDAGHGTRPTAVTPGGSSQPPAWKPGNRPTLGDGSATPTGNTRSRATDAPAGRTGGQGTWKPPSGNAGTRVIDGGPGARQLPQARDVAVPRKKHDDVPPRYNVDPKPDATWGGANRTPSSAVRPSAPANGNGNNNKEEWKKNTSRPKPAPAVDRGRSGGGGRRPDDRRR